MSNRKKEILLLLGIIVGATVLVGIIMSIPKLEFVGGSDEGWLGYWGSVVGIVGAYAVLKVQLQNDDKKHKAETVDNTFFNLLNLHNEVLKENEKTIKKIHEELETSKKGLIKVNQDILLDEYFVEKSHVLTDRIKHYPREFDLENKYIVDLIFIRLKRKGNKI